MALEIKEHTVKISEKGTETAYQFLATVRELKKQGQLTKWIDGHDILLYEYENKIKAISNICRHFGGPVGYHKCKKEVFTCLWHNWQYSAKDGSCLTNSGLPLRQYDIKVIDENIYINLLG